MLNDSGTVGARAQSDVFNDANQTRCPQRLFPPALKANDLVGVIAPSLPLANMFPVRFERGIRALESELSLRTRIADHVKTPVGGITTDSGEARADAFNDMVSDPDIRAIFCAIGGFNTSDMLPYLDFDLARRNPKFLIGYSDATSLLLSLASRSDWITLHGPMIMPQFGEFPEPFPYTIESLRRVLFDPPAPFVLEFPEFWTNEFLDWGGDEWRSRPRATASGAPAAIWKSGKESSASGILWGGNIETLNFLIGTPYMTCPDRIVLLWEATAEEAALPRVQRALIHLDQTGILSRTAAMLIGRSPDATPAFGATLKDIVLQCMERFDFPIIADLPFGHTDPMAAIPIGCEAQISITDGVSIEIRTGS